MNYVASTVILELWFFSERYHFRLWVLLQLVNTSTADTEGSPLLKVHDFTLCGQKKSWFSAVFPIWIEGYQIIFVRSSSFAKG